MHVARIYMQFNAFMKYACIVFIHIHVFMIIILNNIKKRDQTEKIIRLFVFIYCINYAHKVLQGFRYIRFCFCTFFSQKEWNNSTASSIIINLYRINNSWVFCGQIHYYLCMFVDEYIEWRVIHTWSLLKIEL